MTSVLVRHASAGDRHDWDGDDRSRPLDRHGRKQALALVEQLRPFELRRVVSSPYLRCIETVEPLAAALGVEVEADERLSEGAGRAAAELIGEDGIVLCTHGDVASDLLDVGLKKAEIFVF